MSRSWKLFFEELPAGGMVAFVVFQTVGYLFDISLLRWLAIFSACVAGTAFVISMTGLFGEFAFGWARWQTEQSGRMHWRRECGGRPRKELAERQLSQALWKGVVTPNQYESLKEIVRNAGRNEEANRSIADNTADPERYLLWRSGILYRRGTARATTLAIVCGVVLGFTFMELLNQLGVTFDGNAFGPGAVKVVPAGMSFFFIRVFHNRKYKGAWLPDEALSIVRCIFAVGVGIAGFGTFIELARVGTGSVGGWNELRVASMTFVGLIGISGLVHLVLWMVGRVPYRYAGYPVAEWEKHTLDEYRSGASGPSLE